MENRIADVLQEGSVEAGHAAAAVVVVACSGAAAEESTAEWAAAGVVGEDRSAVVGVEYKGTGADKIGEGVVGVAGLLAVAVVGKYAAEPDGVVVAAATDVGFLHSRNLRTVPIALAVDGVVGLVAGLSIVDMGPELDMVPELVAGFEQPSRPNNLPARVAAADLAGVEVEGSRE